MSLQSMKIESNDLDLLEANSSLQLQDEQALNQQSSTNSGSTDFVKKLFQMLEDDSYKKIVRWTDTGDSFVIIDTNEFTRDILPKHFKHSNFASFVRQLNKYDFHKVKVSSEEKKAGKNKAENGENAWEFKHPEFRMHDRESLENIKRKGPTQKKNAEERAAENVTKLTSQMKELKSEARELREDLKSIKGKYNTVIESILNMKKTNDAYHTAFTNLTTYLSSQGIKVPAFNAPMTLPQQPPQQNYRDDRRRTSSTSSIPQQQTLQQHPPAQQLHQLSSTPAIPTSAMTSNTPPMNSHSSTSNVNTPSQAAPGPPPPQQDTAPVVVPTRPPNSPFHVLLVEDDAVCIQLCRKFLMKYGCTVEVVTDGLSAISFVEKVKYDLVLMDIVMPNLDGATATSVIRSFDSTTPIIAMTGNIQDSDLLTYLRNGMTDILAKPFSQHDLFAMLEKHLRNGGLDLNIDDPLVKKQRIA